MHLEALEHANRIVFMHRVRNGPANRSYGLQVAALAGVPPAVIEDARSMLESLEADSNARTAADAQGQMPLFERADAAPPVDRRFHELMDAVDPDSMSPREALETLYKLKALLD